MKILTTEEELRAVIGVAASEFCDNENVRDLVGEEEMISLAAYLSMRVLDHFTGRARLDEDLVEAAKEIDRFCLGGGCSYANDH